MWKKCDIGEYMSSLSNEGTVWRVRWHDMRFNDSNERNLNELTPIAKSTVSPYTEKWAGVWCHKIKWKVPVSRRVFRPRADPILQWMCIVLEEEPPVLSPLNSLLKVKAGPVSHWLVSVAGHELHLLFHRLIEEAWSCRNSFLQYWLANPMVDDLCHTQPKKKHLELIHCHYSVLASTTERVHKKCRT